MCLVQECFMLTRKVQFTYCTLRPKQTFFPNRYLDRTLACMAYYRCCNLWLQSCHAVTAQLGHALLHVLFILPSNSMDVSVNYSMWLPIVSESIWAHVPCQNVNHNSGFWKHCLWLCITIKLSINSSVYLLEICKLTATTIQLWLGTMDNYIHWHSYWDERVCEDNWGAT